MRCCEHQVGFEVVVEIHRHDARRRGIWRRSGAGDLPSVSISTRCPLIESPSLPATAATGAPSPPADHGPTQFAGVGDWPDSGWTANASAWSAAAGLRAWIRQREKSRERLADGIVRRRDGGEGAAIRQHRQQQVLEKDDARRGGDGDHRRLRPAEMRAVPVPRPAIPLTRSPAAQ